MDMQPPSPSPSHDALRFGRFELRRIKRRLLIDGRPAPLGARAFDLLVVLAERPGELFGKNVLLGRDVNEAAAFDRASRLAASALGNTEFERLQAEGRLLRDEDIAAIAFGRGDALPRSDRS